MFDFSGPYSKPELHKIKDMLNGHWIQGIEFISIFQTEDAAGAQEGLISRIP
jgi:hypothetical protein